MKIISITVCFFVTYAHTILFLSAIELSQNDIELTSETEITTFCDALNQYGYASSFIINEEDAISDFKSRVETFLEYMHNTPELKSLAKKLSKSYQNGIKKGDYTRYEYSPGGPISGLTSYETLQGFENAAKTQMENFQQNYGSIIYNFIEKNNESCF